MDIVLVPVITLHNPTITCLDTWGMYLLVVHCICTNHLFVTGDKLFVGTKDLGVIVYSLLSSPLISCGTFISFFLFSLSLSHNIAHDFHFQLSQLM